MGSIQKALWGQVRGWDGLPQKEDEFSSLKQVSMTEEEYERKFVELEKYAHGLSEESRVGRFIGGRLKREKRRERILVHWIREVIIKFISKGFFIVIFKEDKDHE